MSHHPVDRFMEKGVEGGVFPGASLLVSQHGKTLWKKVCGAAQKIPRPRKLTPETLFDIASLTKPFCTATLFMIAVQQKKCSLSDPIEKFYAHFKNKKIRIVHLLNHTSGLPAWKPYFEDLLALSPSWMGTAQGKAWLVRRILDEPLENPPGKKVCYSDLGYILLGNILEKIWDEPLETLFERLIARRLKLQNTFFRTPSPLPSPLKGEGS